MFSDYLNAIDNEDKTKIEENYYSYFYCRDGQDIPEFTFENFPIITVKCDNPNHRHNDINNLNKEEFIRNINEIIGNFGHILKSENYNQQDNFKKLKINDLPRESIEELKKNNLICSEHELVYKYYCKNCEKHQCKKCRFKNLSSEKCKHENYEDFTQKERDIRQQIKEINDLIDSLNNNDKSFDDEYFMKYLKNSSYIEKFKSFIEHLFNHFELLKHETIIKNISNLYEFLIKSRNKEKEKLEIDKIDVVYSPFKLTLDIDSTKIIQIKISAFCVNMAIFDKFDKDDFPNLKKLTLKNSNISDISVLTKINFLSLEKLNLNSNDLGDNMIDNIHKIKAPNLKNLNLSFNYFTDFRLFTAVEIFENLEIFKMEKNPFNENVDINTINKEYNFLSLKKLYLINGIFCNKTIGLLTKFKFKNLEVLDISSNNIESLNFLNNLQFVDENNIPLKEVYLNNGDITDKELDNPFKKYRNLERIVLKNNLIKKFDSLKGITNFFSRINKAPKKDLVIDCSENPIESLDSKN